MSRRTAALLFAALAAASGALTAWLLPRPDEPPPAPRPAAPAAEKAHRTAPGPLSSSRSSPPSLSPDARAALLEEIEDMAVQYDASVLSRLEPLLSHHDAEVRAAAAQGIVTLGETAGAALLRKAALTASSPEEAVRLKSQADYLELPSAVPDQPVDR